MSKISAAVAMFWAALATSVAAQTPATPPHSGDAGTTFVQVGRLLADPATGVVQRDKTLVIRGNQVVEIRDGFVSGQESGDHTVDLRADFVLPGLIDSHVHLTSESSPTSRLDGVTRSNADEAVCDFDDLVPSDHESFIALHNAGLRVGQKPPHLNERGFRLRRWGRGGGGLRCNACCDRQPEGRDGHAHLGHKSLPKSRGSP